MTTLQLGIHDIVAELEILTNKLRCTTDEGERRALLRQFRVLLDGADNLATRYSATE
jgi:hypothetical protein